MRLPPKGGQNRALYDYLAEGNKITSLEAAQKFGILNLPQRIFDLKKKFGLKIGSEVVHKGKVKYCVYWMER